MRESKVVLFKNKGFNQKTSRNPFVRRRTVTRLVDAPAFLQTHTYVAKLENSFGYTQRVEHISSEELRYIRFDYEEVCEVHLANLTEAREQLASMNLKKGIFNGISKETFNSTEGRSVSRDTR